jgi:type VI secretion system secreted protein VgrG
VISGVVPNALHPSPVTSGNHTKNVIQTGGRNRFEFEDKAGQERVTMSTPYANTYVRMGSPNEDHELIIHTDQKTLLDAGLDYDVTVSNAGAGNWTTVVNQGNATLSVPQDYWGAGIENGFSVTAADGINFRINDGHDVPAAPAATEGFTVVVTQKGAEIHAQETITITSDAALSMTAPGLVQFHSTASDVVVHAHKELKIIADGEQHSLVAGKGWETTYGDSESHTEGNLVTDRKSNSSEETHGNSKTTRYGNQEVVTDGTTLEVTQGSSTDIFIGGQLSAVGSSSVELTQGLGAEIKLGLFTEITNAYKFALSGSAGIKLNFGVVIGNESMKHELWGEAVKAKSAALRNFFVYAHVGSLQLRTFGIHCHVP